MKKPLFLNCFEQTMQVRKKRSPSSQFLDQKPENVYDIAGSFGFGLFGFF